MAKALVLGQKYSLFCRFEFGIYNKNQNGQRDDQQNEGVVFGQGGKAEEDGKHYGSEGREPGEVGQEGFHFFSPPVPVLAR